MKIKYVQCGWRNEYRTDPRSYEHCWTSSWSITYSAIIYHFEGSFWIQHNDQLPVDLLAHLVERCTGVAEVMGSNSVRAWIFFRPYFSY